MFKQKVIYPTIPFIFRTRYITSVLRNIPKQHYENIFNGVYKDQINIRIVIILL